MTPEKNLHILSGPHCGSLILAETCICFLSICSGFGCSPMSVQRESGETEQDKVQESRVLKQALEHTVCQGCTCKAEFSFHLNTWDLRLTALSPVRDF